MTLFTQNGAVVFVQTYYLDQVWRRVRGGAAAGATVSGGGARAQYRCIDGTTFMDDIVHRFDFRASADCARRVRMLVGWFSFFFWSDQRCARVH